MRLQEAESLCEEDGLHPIAGLARETGNHGLVARAD